MINTKEINVMGKMPYKKITRDIITPNPFKASNELKNPVACPKNVDGVYSLGVSLQNYIGAIYLELNSMNKEYKKNIYTNLALNQLGIKKEIEKLAKDNLNRLLAYFYENGGPIIEAPVSEQSVNEIRPFFNKIVTNFINQVEYFANRASIGEMSTDALDNEINGQVISMYQAMSSLFKIDEMENAFKDLISVRKIRK